MICPECEAPCWREEVDVGVGLIYGDWMCECGWEESLCFPMTDANWTEWLNEGPQPDAYAWPE